MKLATVVLALLAFPPGAQQSRDSKVVGRTVLQVSATIEKNGESLVVGEPFINPKLVFLLERGKIESPQVIHCTQINDQRRLVNTTVSYPVVLLRCENGIEMTLKGIDLTVSGGTK